MQLKINQLTNENDLKRSLITAQQQQINDLQQDSQENIEAATKLKKDKKIMLNFYTGIIGKYKSFVENTFPQFKEYDFEEMILTNDELTNLRKNSFSTN